MRANPESRGFGVMNSAEPAIGRLVVTGAEPNGRSFLISDGPPRTITKILPGDDALSAQRLTLEVVDEAIQPGETLLAELVHTSQMPPLAGYRPSPDRHRSLDLPPGGTRWSVVVYGPCVQAGIHQTATLDYDIVLSGSVNLELDSGAVRLTAGDAAVLPGVRHGWRAGEDGCTLAIVMISLI